MGDLLNKPICLLFGKGKYEKMGNPGHLCLESCWCSLRPVLHLYVMFLISFALHIPIVNLALQEETDAALDFIGLGRGGRQSTGAGEGCLERNRR